MTQTPTLLKQNDKTMTNTNQSADQTMNETTKSSNLPDYVERADLIINREFQALFSAGTSEREYKELKEDILKRGILDKLIGWDRNKILLDGHTRYKIHEELDLKEPLPIQWLSFETYNEAKMWILQHQFIRRNLNLFQRIEAALGFKEIFTAKAKANQEAGVSLNSKEGTEANEEVAKLAKTSSNTVWKVTKILEKKKVKEVAVGIKALRNGDPGVSIHSVYVEATRKKRGENKQLTPSEGAREKIDSKVEHFTTLVSDFVSEIQDKEDGIYIYDTMMKWAREEKAKLKAPKKPRKKATNKSSKKK